VITTPFGAGGSRFYSGSGGMGAGSGGLSSRRGRSGAIGTLRQGSLLLHERLRNATSGRHTIGVRLSTAIARQIRRSGRHRTTLRIRVRARGGRTTTSFRALSLRY
jgi:hypothetical protein